MITTMAKKRNTKLHTKIDNNSKKGKEKHKKSKGKQKRATENCEKYNNNK